LLGRGGQIGRDLESIVSRLGDAALDPRNQMQLLRLVSIGQRTDFDARTHRRGSTNYNRLNFIYYAARLLENTPAQNVTSDVLEHLLQAQSTLQAAWGLAEWNRLSVAGVALSQLEERVRLPMLELVGEDRFAELAELSMVEIGTADRDQLAPVLGKRIQNEIYRQLLLNVISDQWVEYLTKVESLRVSIGMEAYAQRDPLVAYKGQASELFKVLLTDIRMGVISRMFNVQPRRSNATAVEREAAEQQAEEGTSSTAGSAPASIEDRKKKRRRH
jgi:preprotein translocase subunit SecA